MLCVCVYADVRRQLSEGIALSTQMTAIQDLTVAPEAQGKQPRELAIAQALVLFIICLFNHHSN